MKSNPDNVDAKLFLIKTKARDFNTINEIKEVVEKEKKKLTKQGFFKSDSIGIFWGLIETRPYMRALSIYAEEFNLLGRYSDAIKVYEEMIRLCDSDNMGVRYPLMADYMLLERFEEFNKLASKYEEDCSIIFKTPSALYEFKKGNYEKCLDILKEIQKENKYFIKLVLKPMLCDDVDTTYYSIGSQEEVACMIEIFSEVFMMNEGFIMFIEKNKAKIKSKN